MSENLIIEHARPEQLSAAQRAFEIAAILTTAIVRSNASGQVATVRKLSPVRLAKSGNQSVHTTPPMSERNA
jgi:hypothetical protein